MDAQAIVTALRKSLVSVGFVRRGRLVHRFGEEVVWSAGINRVFNGPSVDIELFGCLLPLLDSPVELPPPDRSYQITAVYRRARRPLPAGVSQEFDDLNDFYVRTLSARSDMSGDERMMCLGQLAEDLWSYTGELSSVEAVLDAARQGRLVGTFSRALNALVKDQAT